MKMQYKLMAVDIDGTLLNSSGLLTDNTKSAIKNAVRNGLIFTISTGRPIQGIEFLIKEFELDVPLITYNGAMVIMSRSREILYESNLLYSASKSIIDQGLKYGTTMMVWSDNQLFVTKINEKTESYKLISGVEPVLCNDFEDAIKKGATKILWYDDIEKINIYHSEVGKFISSGVNLHTSRPFFLEFVDQNASKAIALEKIGEHFGISQSEIIAVGDGYNDLSMIEYAGLGVAMGNAPADIKEKADFVTHTNDDDGIVEVINRFVLE